MTELLFLLVGLGGGTGGCLAGAVLVELVGAVVLALVRTGGRVLGAEEGAAVETTVFATAGAALEGSVFAALLAGGGSFPCSSFVSWEVEGGLLGGSRGWRGCGSWGGSDSEPGWLLDEPAKRYSIRGQKAARRREESDENSKPALQESHLACSWFLTVSFLRFLDQN